MIRLCLLRHAKAVPGTPGMSDFARPLAERGFHDSEALGKWLRRAGLLPDIILCSPALRTRQTLEGVLPGIGIDPDDVVYDERIYDASEPQLAKIVLALPKGKATALLIGHNPGIQALAMSLAGSGEREAILRMEGKYPTGGLAVLAAKGKVWSGLGAGSCRLAEFVTPADLP